MSKSICIKLEDVIKGIVEGMVFIVQKSSMPDLSGSEYDMININGNKAHILKKGINEFFENKNDIRYRVDYQFASDDKSNDSSLCGIELYVYHPSNLFLFYGSNDKDIKENIRDIKLNVKHYCTESCRNMNDYDGVISCEINCERVVHDVKPTELVVMMM